MSSTTYIAVYAHPHIPVKKRANAVILESGARGKQLLDQLFDEYPDYRDDLNSATLWKASRFTAVRLPL